MTVRLDVWTRFKDDGIVEGKEIRDYLLKEFLEKHGFNSKVNFRPHTH